MLSLLFKAMPKEILCCLRKDYNTIFCIDISYTTLVVYGRDGVIPIQKSKAVKLIYTHLMSVPFFICLFSTAGT